MRHTKKLLALLALTLALAGMGTSAQEAECPVGLVCVDYEENIIRVDPECGPVQAIVTEEVMTRTTSLEGEETSYTLTGIVVVKIGEVYEIVSYFESPATGNLEGVRFGGVGCLNWGDVDDRED